MVFGLLVLAAIAVALVVVLARRPDDGAGGRGPAGAGAVRDLVDRWRAAGLITDEQAVAIGRYEAAHPAAPASSAPAAAIPATATGRARREAVAEALGYLGAALALGGLALVVSRTWPQLALASRLALTGGAAVVLTASGAFVDDSSGPGRRLRGVLWLGASALAASCTGLATDHLLGPAALTVTAVAGATVGLHSGALWRARPDRPLQQIAALAASAVTAGAVAAGASGGTAAMGAVTAVGVTLLVLALTGRTPAPLVTETVAAVALIAGPLLGMGNEATGAYLLGPAVVAVLFGVAAGPGREPDAPERLVAGIAGGVAALQLLPAAVGYFAEGAAVVTGLAVWATGGGVLLLGWRRVVLAPRAVEAAGGVLLLAGAAVTGVASPATATLLGLATAAGLVAAGTRPGRLGLSLLGALGLLVNVPWAVSWFFPGTARAPLMVTAAGAAILVVAAGLARAGRPGRGAGGPAPPTAPPALGSA